MKKTLALGLFVALATGMTAGSASAVERGSGTPGRLVLRSHGLLLADNVVVTPGSSGQPAPQASATTVQAAPPAQQTAVVDSGHTNKVVHTDVEAPHNYMGTLAVSALMGGVVGALVGGSLYYLGNQDNARNIAYWAAGGVLLGTGVGVVQIMVQEGRASNATALNKLPSDPAPTFRLALFRTSF